MNPPTSFEQRQSRRYPFQCPVAFADDVIGGTGRLLNLSITGCRLHTGKGIEDDTHIHVFLFLPDYDLPLKILAAVRWAKDDTCGLEFIRMGQDQEKRLREFVNCLDMRPVH